MALKIQLFGPPTVSVDGRPIDFGRRKAAALLAYLAVTGTAHTRDNLALLFWPENDHTTARSNLRRILSVIKKNIGEEYLESEGETVSLRLSAEVDIDVVRFRELYNVRCGSNGKDTPDSAECMESMKKAAALYTSHFMQGFTLSDSPDFDDWQFYESDTLRNEYAHILSLLIKAYRADNNYGAAVSAASTLLHLDPMAEQSHRTLMELYAESGRRSAALHQYEKCRKILSQELNAEPEKSTTDLYEKIKSNSYVPGQPAAPDQTGPPRQKTQSVRPGKPAGKRRLFITIPSAAVICIFLILFFFTPLFGFLERHRPTLVVLPLQSLSEENDQEWFATGMTDTITTQLAKISGLRVISHTSAIQLAEKKTSVKEIRDTLNVDYIIEGTIIKVKDWVRISIQLIGTKDDTHIWAYEYKQQLEEVLMLQAIIASDIAEQVYVKLTSEEKKSLEQKKKLNPAAQEAYLRGFYKDQILMSVESNEIAKEYYEKAIELDPDFALGYVGLANYYWGEVQYAEISAEKGMPLAKENIAKALEVDPSCAEAYTISGFIKLLYDWDFDGAEADFKKALWLNPNYAEAYRWYGSLLGIRGELSEAIRITETAWTLDPVSPLNAVNAAARCYNARQYDRAIEICTGLLRDEPDFWMARWVLGWCYTQQGRHDEAIAELKQTVDGVGLESLFRLGHAYGAAGRHEEAENIIRRFDETVESQYVPAYYYAVVYTGIGEIDKAFEYLDKAVEERHMHVLWEVRDPKFDILREDPRWKEHLKRLNLK